MHFVVLMDVVAAIKISAGRAALEGLQSGVVSLQNIPLLVVTSAVVLVIEMSPRKRFTGLHVFLLLLSAAVLLLSSFFLPPVGESIVEVSLFAYGALVVQFSSAMVIAFSRRPNIGRILIATVLVVGISTIAGFAYTFSNGDALPGAFHSDAAVVLGASVWGRYEPSPTLKARLDTAICIFKSGGAKKIVVTGGTRRFGTFESHVQASYLKGKGVPDSDVIVERGTFSTSEQAEYIKRIVVDSLGMRNVIVVTDNWHLPRAIMMCRWEGLTVHGKASRHRSPLSDEVFSRFRESAGIQVFVLFGA